MAQYDRESEKRRRWEANREREPQGRDYERNNPGRRFAFRSGDYGERIASDYSPQGYYTGGGFGRGFDDEGNFSLEQDWQRRERQLRSRPGQATGRGPRGYRRSNERIFEDVCDRLTQHGRIDASDIEVEVEDGEVTLKGTVNDRQTKRMAEKVAESITGVVDVHNRLRISGYPGGGAGRIDEVGESGVYPASGPLPGRQAEVRGMASWGQGERGAEGYEDHGESELRIPKNE